MTHQTTETIRAALKARIESGSRVETRITRERATGVVTEIIDDEICFVRWDDNGVESPWPIDDLRKENEPMKLELCTNNEAIRDWCGLDWEGIEEGDYAANQAAEQFASAVWNALESAGYDVEHAKGQRSTCHGWNGANMFRWRSGPVGSFDVPTAEQAEEIRDIIDRCNAAAAHDWRAVREDDE